MDYTIALETLQKRKSIRNYDSAKPINSKTKEALLQFIDSVTTEKVRIEWVDGGLGGVKLGTYGFYHRSFILSRRDYK